MAIKKYKWLKENVVGIVILLVILLLIVLISTGNIGILGKKLSQEDIDNFEMNPTGYSCKINMQSEACVDEDVTSTLRDGENAFCKIGYKYEGGDWNFYGDVNTNEKGEATLTDSAGIAGEYTFAAFCIDENGKICRTNDEKIEIKTCEYCVDSDGGEDIFEAGHVTAFEDKKQFYDKCTDSNSVTEYWCGSASSVVRGEVKNCPTGYECIDTRSGGFCSKTTTNNNGDLLGSDSGSGSTSNIVNNFEIDMNNLGSGNCKIGGTLSTQWDYAGGECQGIQGMEGIKWDFYDSSGLEYSRIDTSPIGIGVDLGCGLYYDGETPFLISMSKIQGLESCNIDYEWEVRLVACECE